MHIAKKKTDLFMNGLNGSFKNSGIFVKIIFKANDGYKKMCYNNGMKSRHGRKRYKIRRRHSRLSASIWSPILKLAGAVLGTAAGIALITFLTMFLLETVFKVDTPLKPGGFTEKLAGLFGVKEPFVVSPTPYHSPVPTATPHPMELFNSEDEEKEIVLPPDLSYKWLGDPFCCNGRIIFTAGTADDGNKVLMKTLLEYDTENGNVRKLNIKPENDHVLFPVFNENWLVYLDAHYTTGGKIRAVNLKSAGKEPFTVKEIYVGQPEIRLDGDYITWLDRTGSERDKIFVCHIPTLETTVVQYFNKSSYGTSMPFLKNGRLIWAAEDNSESTARITSVLKYVDLSSSTISEFHPEVYIHNPEYNGRYYTWIDSHYGEDSTLYVYDGNGTPAAVDEGIVEFGIAEKYVAYEKNEAVWIYLFETGKTYRITPEREQTQFLGVSGGYIFWMDVTSRERDIIKYIKLPLD